MKIEERDTGYHVVADNGKAIKMGDNYFSSAYLPKTADLTEITEIDEKDVPQFKENEDEQIEENNL